jgi:hypothetical protein
MLTNLISSHTVALIPIFPLLAFYAGYYLSEIQTNAVIPLLLFVLLLTFTSVVACVFDPSMKVMTSNIQSRDIRLQIQHLRLPWTIGRVSVPNRALCCTELSLFPEYARSEAFCVTKLGDSKGGSKEGPIKSVKL